MGSFHWAVWRTHAISSVLGAWLVALTGNAALATMEPAGVQEVDYYVTNELLLFVCWKDRDQCTAFAQADHHGTASLCPHLLSERSLNSMVAFLIRLAERRSGAGLAVLHDCQAGLGYWQGRFCIALAPNILGVSTNWCAYATEVPEMRLSKNALRRLLQSQRER